MPPTLFYGVDASLSLDVGPDAVLAECRAPREGSIADPAAAVTTALAAPLDFPPVSRAAVPGDRIAIALADGVPRSQAAVAGVVKYLVETGTLPEAITVVRASNGHADVDPRAQLPAEMAGQVGLVTHDPDDRAQLAYLAASHEQRPIFVNRTLFDADLVLPIGCQRLDESLGAYGVHGGLFPSFADRDSIDRFRAPSSAESKIHVARRRQEADEAARQLGIFITIQLVPAAEGHVLHVVAGEPTSVARQAAALCAAAWHHSVRRRASLVVASIGGDPHEQSWDNLARALAAASRVAEPGGAIALCTELAVSPGTALDHLSAAQNLSAALREIRRDRSDDAWTASQLAQQLDRGSIYLLSELDDELVESLGMAPVQSPEEIERLAHHHDTCILLEDAQYAVPTVEDEAEAELA
ncbi:MAG: lactate racemase domain-containing protein [Pirellulales bacterium]